MLLPGRGQRPLWGKQKGSPLSARTRCHIAAGVRQAVLEHEPAAPFQPSLVPLLGVHVRAHESTVSSIIVLEDQKHGCKVVVSASLDKTIAAWRLSPNEDSRATHPYYCEVQKIAAPGGPIFSMAPSRPIPGQPTPKPSPDGKSAVPTIFCGNAAKEVLSWQPFMPTFNNFKLDGHTGWVRAVATYDKYLFSSGCNYLRQWDCTYATPKEINKVKLFTGDILAITAGFGFVCTAGADGHIRSWRVDKPSGAMTESAALEHAHDKRIYALLRGNGVLYSCGGDGHIKMWSQGKLEPLAQVLNAHGGEKVRCMAMAGNGVLYTGGDDHLIRAWSPRTLQPLADFEPLRAHSSPIRVLRAGKSELLVSGDSDGYINFFEVPPVRLLEQVTEVSDPFAHLFMATSAAATAAASASMSNGSAASDLDSAVCELDLALADATAAANGVAASASAPASVKQQQLAEAAAAAAAAASPALASYHAPETPSPTGAEEFDASLSPVTSDVHEELEEAAAVAVAAAVSAAAAPATAASAAVPAAASPATHSADTDERDWTMGDPHGVHVHGELPPWVDELGYDGMGGGSDDGGSGDGDGGDGSGAA